MKIIHEFFPILFSTSSTTSSSTSIRVTNPAPDGGRAQVANNASGGGQGFVHVGNYPLSLFYLRSCLLLSMRSMHFRDIAVSHLSQLLQRGEIPQWSSATRFWTRNENWPGWVRRRACHTRHGRAAASEKPLAVLGSQTSGVTGQLTSYPRCQILPRCMYRINCNRCL